MARPLRLQFPGATYHITSRGNEQKPIFRSDADRLHFLGLLSQVVARFGWLVYSWTLMTNHYHLVVETPGANLSRGMHWLNGRYAGYFNRRRKRRGHLFQGRFGSVLIEKQTHLNEVLRYTVLNPVRAGMVAHPGEYRWSSYNACAGVEPPPAWLCMDWLYALDDDPARAHEIYRDHVAAGIGSTESIWEGLEGQVYLGSPEWIEQMRQRVEDEPRSAEHPAAHRLLPRTTMEQVLESVAEACQMTCDSLRRPGRPAERMLAAWVGWHHAVLRLREIAAALRLRSTGHISQLVRQCEIQLARDQLLRQRASHALAGLRIALPAV